MNKLLHWLGIAMLSVIVGFLVIGATSGFIALSRESLINEKLNYIFQAMTSAH
jgi:hypothetical protein